MNNTKYRWNINFYLYWITRVFFHLHLDLIFMKEKVINYYRWAFIFFFFFLCATPPRTWNHNLLLFSFNVPIPTYPLFIRSDLNWNNNRPTNPPELHSPTQWQALQDHFKARHGTTSISVIDWKPVSRLLGKPSIDPHLYANNDSQ